MSMDRNAKVYVAGHRGLVGGALVRRLTSAGYSRVITRTHEALDLTRQSDVLGFFEQERPEYVFLATARVGGISANHHYPGQFIYDNLAIGMNVIQAAWLMKVKRLLFLGSSCTYPKMATQPIKESEYLTGPLESTNQPYAVAKIAGIELCAAYNRQYGTDFRPVMPANTYGPGDRYDSENSHVIPALILKMHEAKVRGAPEITLWGTGSPRREFLYCDDLAEACVFVMNLPKERYPADNVSSIVNIGSEEEIAISDLTGMVREVVNYEGRVVWDPSRPDGAPRKVLDSSLLRSLGWRPSIGLATGLRQTYESFLSGRRGLCG